MMQPRAQTLPRSRPLWSGLMVLAAAVGIGTAAAADGHETIIESHGYSFYGDLKYPADYTHFDYVNPDAPKGGEISLPFVGTLDSMNPYSGKGRAHLFSIFAYESLLGESPAQDGLPADVYGEAYCLLCETLEYPEDKSWVQFNMRKDATFSDGTPVTAHDIAFSHNLLLDEGLQSYANAVRKRIPKVEVIDDHTIKFYFAEGISRRSLIEQVGGVPVWPSKWMKENGVGLKDSWLDSPPGSGAYVISDVDLSRNITLTRNPDYWGKDLPINKGRFNFDTIRLEIISDDTASFEAFKSGLYTFRREGDSKKWAAGYEFPKVTNGFIKKEELLDGSPPTPSGVIFNLGREVLQDRDVRKAISLMFNFEWTNESLQYGLFEQRTSFSEGTPVMAQGVPEGAELEILTSLGDLAPPDMLSDEVVMPHTSSAARLLDRRNARAAQKLLDDAGWEVVNGQRQKDGKPLKLSFLFNSTASPTVTAAIENFVSNLTSIGIDVALEKVDSSQYTTRERARDYDMVYDAYAAFLGTGTGLAQYYGSEAAEYSLFNPAGLASPMVDAIIEASLAAETREEEQAAMTALDRALRYEFFMIPMWYNPVTWVVYYDQYNHPETQPPYATGHLDYWWYDEEKAQKLRDAGVLR
ncbi:extracellular solute-binding protein [Sulfitobacter sp. S190]|uniref:extracellular solute-binding protein n=1 Tax=Sulfitobacter sp. S190 TaxID=2867022 RepID=UPI0021A3BA32|nr:extracellular solute-binding protein [Sulfitobacter sp. S190]UWR22833.1 extracellular solute-binding protein [Sulfitobacter sp. S190]